MDPETKTNEITQLLSNMQAGDPMAREQLSALVFHQLKRTARRLLQGERRDHTLQPTALVDDALMKLIGNGAVGLHNRAQFFAVAAKVMRHILTDHARAHRANKRGGALLKVELGETLAYEWRNAEEILALDQALDRLAGYDSALSELVEMRFFAGMTEEEIAAVTQKSTRTIKRDWKFARDWLYAELTTRAQGSAERGLPPATHGNPKA